MKATKQRLSASVDAELLDAAESAAKRGEVANVSAWVNDAMRLKVEHDRGLAELAAVIADFEAEHGEITRDEIEKAERLARSRAMSVRGTRAGETRAAWSPSRRRRR
jgi:Arc/MetJ-type ribon-helix-helix transcriptional regulator